VEEPKKTTLKLIVSTIRDFDFSEYDPIKDKQRLLTTIQYINSKLGKLLREFENEST